MTRPSSDVSAPFPLCASYPWWGLGQIRKLSLAKIDASAAASPSYGDASSACDLAPARAFAINGDETSAAQFILAAFAHPERGLVNVTEVSRGIISLTAYTHTCGEQGQPCVSGYLQAGDPRGAFYTLDMTALRDGDDWRYLEYDEGGYVMMYH